MSAMSEAWPGSEIDWPCPTCLNPMSFAGENVWRCTVCKGG
jgi:hypothetical protein